MCRVVDLGFGCANLGSMGAGAGGRRSVELVQHAFDAGITFFDTADAYGDGSSEQVLGRAFRHRPDGLTIATKGGYVFRERPWYERVTRRGLRPVMRHIRPAMSRVAETARGPAYVDQDFSVAHLDSGLDASLRRLDTDRIDLYQLHEPGSVDTDGVLEWAARVTAAGKIGLFGVSVGRHEDAATWLRHPIVTSVQLPFGVLDHEAGDEVIPAAMASARTVIVRGILGSGVLDERLSTDEIRQRTDRWESVVGLRSFARTIGVDTIQLAVWFVRARRDVSTMLVGMSSAQHVDDIVAASGTPLPGPEIFTAIDDIVGARR